MAPWAPPYLARSNRYQNEIAEGGQFLGRTIIAEGSALELEIPGVNLGWARNVWEPIIRLIETRPFFFSARDVESAISAGDEIVQEVFYGWMEDQATTKYEQNVYGTISLTARGIVT